MNINKADKYLRSFCDLYTYNIKKNLAARWGLIWAIFFISISIIAHYLHDYSAYYPQNHSIHWLVSFLPLIFYPIVGATGTLAAKENKETSKKLKLSNIRYKTLIENLPEIIYSSTQNNKYFINFISNDIENISGYKPEDFYSSPEIFKTIIHPDDRELILEKFKEINKNIVLKYRIIHKHSKEVFYVIDHSIPIKEDNKIIGIEGIIIDITNEVKSKQRLKALTKEMINTQEFERKRIAKELHDELGQALSTIKINLNLMEKNLGPNSSKVKKTIRNTDEIVDTLIVDLKRISLDLRPSMLDFLGLKATLQWYIKEFKKRTNIDINCNISGLKKRLPSDTEIALYRIVQEALTNIVKHSLANKVKIDINDENKIINMSIEDNGKGFSVEKAFDPETSGISFGIIGMQERVKNLGGDFDITSESGKGTRLSFHVPINN